MNILITGGAGYIGCSLAELLVADETVNSVVIYDNLSRGIHNFFFGTPGFQKLRFIHADILDSYQLSNALENINIVIHLAAHVAFPYNHIQNLQYEQINRWGTQHVVKLSQNCPTVERFFYLSSTAVYGFNNQIKIDDEEQPANAYASSKLSAEQYVRLLNKPYCILRAGNVFGYNRCIRLDSVLNKFFFDAIINKKIFIYGNGEQKRPFVYLDNLTETIYNWIFNNECNSITVDFNASMNELKEFLLTQSGEVEYQYLNQNQEFPGQSILGYDKPEVRGELLSRFYKVLNNNLIIKRTLK